MSTLGILDGAMKLMMEIISANGEALGPNVPRRSGRRGARIGRSRECDWVIDDLYVARIDARIRCVSGSYYVEGTGLLPPTLNDPSNFIPNHEPQLLRSGDRFLPG